MKTLVKKFEGVAENNSLPKFGVFEMHMRKCAFAVTKNTTAKILSTGVTFVGGATEATINTPSTTLETTSAGDVSIKYKYDITTVAMKKDCIFKLDNTFLSSLQIVDDNNDNSNSIEGNIENLKDSPIYFFESRYISDGSKVYGDISVAFQKISIAQNDVSIILMATNRSGISGNIEFINNVGSQINRFAITESEISGDISNITAPFKSGGALALKDCRGVSGSIEGFVASQRAAGHTTGHLSIYLKGTNCTYQGYVFTNDRGYDLIWDANNISFT